VNLSVAGKSLLFVLLIAASQLTLAAKAVTYDAEKCRFDIPDSWTEKNIPDDKAAYLNPDQTKSFTMRITQIPTSLTLDSSDFINGLEKSIVAGGATITDRQHLPLGGIDAYVVDSTQTASAGTVYNRMMVTIANGYAYGFNISKLNAKPSDDDELKALTASFGFLGTPDLPKKEDPAEKLGFYVGVFIGILGAIATLKWILRLAGCKT
jgi:hypothetical protein